MNQCQPLRSLCRSHRNGCDTWRRSGVTRMREGSQTRQFGNWCSSDVFGFSVAPFCRVERGMAIVSRSELGSEDASVYREER